MYLKGKDCLNFPFSKGQQDICGITWKATETRQQAYCNSLFRALTQGMHVTDRATLLTAAEEQPAKKKQGII